MNPHKMHKVDLSGMSEQEQKAFKMYGKLPAKTLATKMQKDRKYFDSGDYMMSKAGVKSAQAPGTAIPTPEGVPHASPPTNDRPIGLSSSPTGNAPAPSPGIEQLNQGRYSPNQGVGVGISPAATSEAIEMPKGGMGHARRGSESQPRHSPPGTLREQPSSSFPISHAPTGSSPVKQSSLGHR